MTTTVGVTWWAAMVRKHPEIVAEHMLEALLRQPAAVAVVTWWGWEIADRRQLVRHVWVSTWFGFTELAEIDPSRKHSARTMIHRQRPSFSHTRTTRSVTALPCLVYQAALGCSRNSR